VFSWLASFYPVRVAAEVIGVVAIMVEGLERRPVTPREQEEEFRSAVIANMTEGLFAFDRERRLTFLNAAASKMIGWSENELRGRSVHAAIQFQHPDGSVLTEERSEMVSVLKLGRSIRGQTGAFTRKDGSIFPVAYSAAPLIDHGDVTGVVVVFRDTTEEWAEQREMKRALDELEWVGRTRDALDDGKLKLYSQPIIPLAGDKPSEELLIRMVGREGEIIRPAVFLPAAEKYGLIGDIDKWVVTQAARLAGDGRCVHANLSALSISNLHLLAHIERALSAASAHPSNLVFEITETALVEDLDAGAAFARGLCDIGCELALDDFGTGYSGFSILKKLPIKYLKIDLEFVLDLVSNPSNQHVVKAIVSLAEGFGQKTVGEGVEDGATLALLSDYGVDYAQGYHLGRPDTLERAKESVGLSQTRR
jgi:PAS domain S-box-containing protein